MMTPRTATPGDAMPQRALVRSRRHRMIGGVCGGLADWLGWDPTLVRILYVLGSILSVAFPGTIVYIVLWLIMPEGD
jgi:phage shock protein PspC (stress-responsive transcriptional regulator)